ncbi:hypothetical protein B0O99DRAFT_379597 [Bisporella sp. PMI_857]|nr:hypothetical protein B0O99DRAFT_379597 [Bisporella sp. PMI_857]
MCSRRARQERCGHRAYNGGITYCRYATTYVDAMGRTRKRKCGRDDSTYLYPGDGLCGRSTCHLSNFRGRWQCHVCQYSPNRWPYCNGANCTHQACARCRAA